MNGYPSIYTDGHSMDVGLDEAARLEFLGLIEPHPGAGEDGILPGDYRLTEAASWVEVTNALADIHHTV